MDKFDVQTQLVGVNKANRQWRDERRQFFRLRDKVLTRLLFEAAANRMAVEEVAHLAGMRPSEIRARMTDLGMDGKMRKSPGLLAAHAAEALANNADLLGVHPSEVDLMSPLAYLPAGSELRQAITDKTTAGVTELDGDVSGNLMDPDELVSIIEKACFDYDYETGLEVAHAAARAVLDAGWHK